MMIKTMIIKHTRAADYSSIRTRVELGIVMCEAQGQTSEFDASRRDLAGVISMRLAWARDFRWWMSLMPSL